MPHWICGTPELVGKKSGMLFVDDFVGVSDSEEHLQKLIDVTVVNGG